MSLNLTASVIDDSKIRLTWDSTSSPYSIIRSYPYTNIYPENDSGSPLFLDSNILETEYDDILLSNPSSMWYGFEVSAPEIVEISTNQVSQIEISWKKPRIRAVSYPDLSYASFRYKIVDSSGVSDTSGSITISPKISKYVISYSGSRNNGAGIKEVTNNG